VIHRYEKGHVQSGAFADLEDDDRPKLPPGFILVMLLWMRAFAHTARTTAVDLSDWQANVQRVLSSALCNGCTPNDAV